ncbi:MAG: aminotransferase class V-fold PLP-dependent enzyme [Gammaproteobacteria bacterium]|nr:aminotransferase class V-fold PLP-dependent enzyme [Gammaproteobacteria bacterium]
MEKQFMSPHADDRHNFSDLLERTSAAMIKHMGERPGMPVDCSEPPESIGRKLSNQSLSANGMTADEILTFVEENIMPWVMPMTHPRSVAWVNSPPAPIAVLCEALAVTMKGGLAGDEASSYLMHSLGRWLMELSGFIDDAGTPDGIALLLGGGSAANLNGLTVARYWAAKRDGWNIREEGLQNNRPAMTYYVSAESHSSVQLCIEQLGIGTASLRVIETDDRFRMQPEALKACIEKDLKAGLRPACVSAVCGSTNTGAVDPLDDIADICEEYNLWLHVDGAYGGIVGLDPEYTQMTKGVNRANSLTLDPHKWLQVPLDCGALLVRDRHLNHENYNLVPDYLVAADQEVNSVPWVCEHMFELTFGDKALKAWAAIARLGFEGVRDMVVNCNNMARLLERLVRDADDLELLSPASTSVANFRYVPKGVTHTSESLDALNQKISDAIADGGEAHIPTTKVNGVVSLRACFLHYENCEDDVYHLVELVQNVGKQYT